MELRLHHYWRSSSSWRVRWALAHKGLDYAPNVVDLVAGQQRDAAFLVDSPMGFVPCLVVDGRPLTESVAIFEWLEETRPSPPLLPRDPWLRARTRQLVEIVNAGTQPFQNLSVLRHVSPETEAQRAWARHFIGRGLEAIERELQLLAREGVGGPFALGESLTSADVFLAPQVYGARRFGVDLAPFPRTLAVEAAALATPAAQASHPDRFAPATS